MMNICQLPNKFLVFGLKITTTYDYGPYQMRNPSLHFNHDGAWYGRICLFNDNPFGRLVGAIDALVIEYKGQYPFIFSLTKPFC